MQSYPKGSEWRKWDLQSCTNHYCNYGGPSLSSEQADKLVVLTGLTKDQINSLHNTLTDEEYARLYVEYVANFTDIDVVAITNHNTGQGIQAILDYLQSKRTDTGTRYDHLQIFPGVEIGAQDKCHVLTVFNLETKNKNKFEYRDGNPIGEISWDTYIEKFLNEIGVDAARFTNQNGHMKPMNSTTHGVEQIIGLHEGWDFIPIFPHPTNKGWFDELPEAVKKSCFKVPIFGIVDMKSATSNTELIQILNGKKTEYGKKVVAQIQTSDAKTLTEIGSAFSWIKADPTLNGLQQIIYEPQERVRNQKDKPEEKRPYFVIDKVRFIDNTGFGNFPSEYIEINQNLTAIVGGKSTGKSLLGYYVAKTIDKEEVLKRGMTAKYDFENHSNFNFEIVWKDGGKNAINNHEPGADDGKRKILYIPQNYLNKLSEEDIKSKETLNEFVLNVLLQIPELKTRYETSLEEIKAIRKKIIAAIGELFILAGEIHEANEDGKKIGDRKGIEVYIAQLKASIEEIKTKSGLTDDELKEYETLIERERGLATIINGLEEDKKTINNLKISLNTKADEILQEKEDYANYLNDPAVKKDFEKSFGSIKNLKPDITSSVEALIRLADTKIKEKQGELITIRAKLKPLVSKVKLQSDLENKNKALKDEEGKINKITTTEKVVKAKTESYKNKIPEISGLYEALYKIYGSLADELKRYEKEFGDIALNITVGFKDAEFNEDVVSEFLNKIDLKAVAKIERAEGYEYQYDPKTHIAFISNILTGLLVGKIKTIKNRPIRDAVMKLLDDRFYLDFKITYKNDPLEKMSPGKKGLILLRLLIELSIEQWPIILDQPEDDLDNRSVYNDLVAFFKAKKKERQILIVTHNPNLVVGADAEEVIVANQDQQEAGRDNRKFKFEYVSGALENSFELTEEEEKAILYRKGIREHVCEILEGGKEAFQKREQKYNFSS